jgi:hypothetical protein
LETQETANSQGNTQQKKYSNAGGLTWRWHKNMYENQWNRIEHPGINPNSYARLIFHKVTKDMRWRKDSLFNKYCWEKWLSDCI